MLEPWGMPIDVAAGDEIIVEVTAADPPAFDAASFTLYAGGGAEIRVLRGEQELYSTFGNPVPATPPGMSVRGLRGSAQRRAPLRHEREAHLRSTHGVPAGFLLS